MRATAGPAPLHVGLTLAAIWATHHVRHALQHCTCCSLDGVFYWPALLRPKAARLPLTADQPNYRSIVIQSTNTGLRCSAPTPPCSHTQPLGQPVIDTSMGTQQHWPALFHPHEARLPSESRPRQWPSPAATCAGKGAGSQHEAG